MHTLRDVFQRLKEERLDLSAGTIQQLDIALRWWEKTHGRMPLRDITPQHVIAVMRKVRDVGRAARTVNNYRKSLLWLWRAAEDMGASVPPLPPHRKIPRLKEPDTMPRAWSQEQMKRLLSACDATRPKYGWGPQHWRALVLTIYDTSLRVGCLLRSTVDQIDRDRCALSVPAHLQKGRRETFQPLHPDTLSLLLSLPRADDRLFPWPWRREALWRKFHGILTDAGLPSTRRDLFHRLRRTSYTYVAVALGKEAAAQHAAHKGDLSSYYLDQTFLPRPNPLDALPRIA